MLGGRFDWPWGKAVCQSKLDIKREQLVKAMTEANYEATLPEQNWGEANAPMLSYALIYAGTGFDNSTNVLGPEVVRMVNEFTGKKCKRLKHELPSRIGNQPQ